MAELLGGSLCLVCARSVGPSGVLALLALAALLGLPLLGRIRGALRRETYPLQREQAVESAAEVLFRELVAAELAGLQVEEELEETQRERALDLSALSEANSLSRRFSPDGQRRIREARFLMAEEVRLRGEAREKAESLLLAVEEESRTLRKAYELREQQLLGWAESTGRTFGTAESG